MEELFPSSGCEGWKVVSLGWMIANELLTVACSESVPSILEPGPICSLQQQLHSCFHFLTASFTSSRLNFFRAFRWHNVSVSACWFYLTSNATMSLCMHTEKWKFGTLARTFVQLKQQRVWWSVKLWCKHIQSMRGQSVPWNNVTPNINCMPYSPSLKILSK